MFADYKPLSVAAYQMGISRTRLYQLIEVGRVPIVVVGQSKYVTLEVINKFIEERKAAYQLRRKKQWEKLPKEEREGVEQ